MNNLYNKIYEAVDKGIQKALIINNTQDNDVSVKFIPKNISNDPDLQKNINKSVKELMANSNMDNYEKVLFHVDNVNRLIRYKAKNFKELNLLYNIIMRCSQAKDKHLINDPKKICMDWIDTSDTVLLLLDDGREIPCHDYQENDKVVFIHLMNTGCTHDIYWHAAFQAHIGFECKRVEHIPEQPVQYSDDYLIKLKDTKKDFAGWEHTYVEPNLKYDVKYKSQTQPYEFVDNIGKYNQTVGNDCDKLGFKAYAPAIGEIYLLHDIQSYINCLCYSYGIKNKYMTESWNNDFTLRIELQGGDKLTSSSFHYYNPWYFSQGHITRRLISSSYFLETYGVELIPLFKKIR